MVRKNYEHLDTSIRSFFRIKGLEVHIEPSGTRGPDLRSFCGTAVGEIKHKTELGRDLKSNYWSHWNSDRKFGGKSSDYQIANDFDSLVYELSGEIRGWIAVIHGQLNHYRKTDHLDAGWLIIENIKDYEFSLKDTLNYLISNKKISNYTIEILSDLGFIEIVYS